MMTLVPKEMREHFTSFGDMKRKYAPEAARLAAERMHQECYECKTCGCWHLASIKPKKTKTRKR